MSRVAPDARSLGRSNAASERGAALVEFALVSLVLYLVLATAIDFGRMMFSAQAVQDVARIAARELAVAPAGADARFDDVLSCDPALAPDTCFADLRARLYDPACLVVDLDDPALGDDAAVDAFFAGMPIVNRALRPLMIADYSNGRRLLRYPGALLSAPDAAGCQGHPTNLTIGIPRVVARGEDGVETIEWVPVLEEVRPVPGDPATGPFSLAANPALPDQPRGVAAVRINYPYQAAMMTGFRPGAAGPNIAHRILADDAAVVQEGAPPGDLIADETGIGPYAGPFGLGRQLAFAGQTVRPFRKLISAQAIYRREVFE